jgi:hypothetical protein
VWLDDEVWRYVNKRVKKVCDLRPEKQGRRLPRILTTEGVSAVLLKSSIKPRVYSTRPLIDQAQRLGRCGASVYPADQSAENETSSLYGRQSGDMLHDLWRGIV